MLVVVKLFAIVQAATKKVNVLIFCIITITFKFANFIYVYYHLIILGGIYVAW
jgi:hypothetical protein